MPSTLGSTTQNLIENLESHKLHLEFEAGTAILKGSHVKLDTDGTVDACADGDSVIDVIGFSLHDAAIGELVTVVCRGHALVIGECAADSQTAGKVELGAMNGTSGYREYAAVSGADNAAKHAQLIGHALNGGDDGDPVKVLLL